MTLADYSDKVVLITGAASGFGKLLAERVAEAGARLALGDLNEDGLNEIAETLRKRGAPVVTRRCDVSKESDCKALVEAAVDEFGRLDIAVNNAGISQDMIPLIDTDEALLDRQHNVNVKGVLFGMKHQIRQMLTQDGGVILNTSSMAGVGGAPYIGAYAASKHAVIGLTKTAAVEYGKKNIRVNAVCPFFTMTPMFIDSGKGHMDNDTAFKALAQSSPMKRLAQPEEVVSVMLMLCAPENTFMNGQAIAVDGGMSAV
ncbi:glucose 1-dehydrogenase [Exilibacterium tricleocarpae]|uniref:Glucose 1-dehydrogenase n=1 Tax=Exilibacterium tricleocarpae TaxID=2591008 RepID=A0A545U993_9GAMM|nr:glucose 1-dehydrogenase [Exilibacterium tricleocarpae]TQV86035.1 glucose 1-dehydrogenase [Exilibacterium tricleocarpae]